MKAWEPELRWGPRYVANELAGTRQAIHTHATAAALRRAEADRAATDEQRAQLLRQAGESEALVSVLEDQVEKLQEVDDARSLFLVRTAVVRAEGEAARYRLGDDDAADEEQVTAQEWLDADHAARLDDDQHRPITDTDVADRHSHELTEPADRREIGDVVVDDIRDVAAREPEQRNEDVKCVAYLDEVADYTGKARRAIDEIHAQQAYEAAMERDTPEARDVDYAREDPYTDHELGDDALARDGVG